MKIAAILLAAGSSRRFGNADKLAADFKGKPLISHAAQTLCDFAPDCLIAVVSSTTLHAELSHFECVVQDYEPQSQSASLRAGIRVAMRNGVDRAIITLADMPFLTIPLMQELLRKCTDNCASATTDGSRRSVPACFPSGSFEALLKLEGDNGAREMLLDLPEAALVSVDGLELADIDSIGDLDRYAAK